MSNLTRREVLGAVAAGGAVGIAGCSGGGGGNGSGGSSNVFESVEIDGDELVVTVASDAVAEITTVPSNDRTEKRYTLGTATISEGASTVGLNLLQDYLPGEHEIIALDDEGNQIGTTTQQLNPQVELEEVITYDMQQEAGWPAGLFAAGDALVTLTNTGNAPAWMSHVLWRDVPNPGLREKTKTNSDVVGMIDKEADPIKSIPPGETITAVTAGSPFYFPYNEFDCTGSHSTKLVVGYQAERVFDVPVNYTTNGDGCQALIQG